MTKLFLSLAIGTCFLLNQNKKQNFTLNVESDTTINIIKPKESLDILENPGIGFVTYQRFNGDSLDSGKDWTQGDGLPIKYQAYKGTNKNINFPQTTLAYWRIYWKYLEPEKGKYQWNLIKQAIDSATKRGQKLMIRIAPHGPDSTNDVPNWFRNLIGNKFNFNNNINSKWAVNYENPLYINYFGKLITEFGKRFDGNGGLESVDLAIIGAWGEGEGSELLSNKTRDTLINIYINAFKKTKLIALLSDEKTNKYIISKSNKIGWRADCLGDLGIWASTQNGWTHMLDWYPEAIIQCGLSDVWKTAPVAFEICRTFWDWKHIQKYTYNDVEYIFNQALKWHISSFNPKSSAIPKEWDPLLQKFLIKMGYRFVLRRLSYNRVINDNKTITLESWWENTGVAPIYDKYTLAFRLKNNNDSVIIKTNADIKKWLPGDNLYNANLTVPTKLKKGQYEFEVGIIDHKNIPVITLAIEGATKDNWYKLGQIQIN